MEVGRALLTLSGRSWIGRHGQDCRCDGAGDEFPQHGVAATCAHQCVGEGEADEYVDILGEALDDPEDL